ncbi:MAG: cyclopropane-fatty-acyl-phospholipid synthase family protein [Steroidobacteraceae bacterium]
MTTDSTTKPSIIPYEHGLPLDSPSWLARLGRRLVLGQLEHLRLGELRVIEGGREHRFGRHSAACDLGCTLYIDHPQMFADVAFGGTVGAGEAYIRGLWRCDNLTNLVRVFLANREQMNVMDRGWASLVSRPLHKLFHLANRNSRSGSARNITAHYDLGNDLYRLMLDETMAYSCAIFRCADASLHDAQIAKFDTACRKLDLRSHEHLLEIGTGWGGLAIHAAEHYGCRVTTTTISQQQFDYARALVAKRGLSDRITVLLQDYRDLNGQFDKIASIEMIEAVGARYLDTYLGKCAALLQPHGAMLLQAITIQDQFYAQALQSVDFIQRFIFPGSFIPSVEAISRSLARVTDLKIFHLQDIGPHYATTLRHWRERFFANVSAVRKLGYPESFVRLWEYYLCYCEGGFAERQLGDVQMLLTKPGCRRAVLAVG